MEKRKISTHSNSDGNSVFTNNKAYIKLFLRNTDTSKTGSEVAVAPMPNRFKLERSQSLLLPRQCAALNQKEQILLNTLERNLTRQKRFSVQIQSHYMLKYQQRLAGYQRLRMFSEGSINGSCIPPQCDQQQDVDRRDRSQTVSGNSAHCRRSTSLVKFDDQSIASVDVNIPREAGRTSVKAGANWKSLRVYNRASLPSLSHLHRHVPTLHRGATTVQKDHRKKSSIINRSNSVCFRGSSDGKIKVQFLTGNIKRDIMLKTLDCSSSSPPDAHLLSVDESSMRPRAYTDPTMSLPEITIEDCSDPVDKSNSDEGMFTVFQSPPRRRANTCPEEFFNRRRSRNRPATPPPTSRNKSPINKFSFGNVNKSPVSFVHHRLDKVAEDGTDGRSAGRYTQRSQNASGHSSAPRRSSCNVRNLRSAFSAVTIQEAPKKLAQCHSANAPGRSTNGHFSVSKPEAIKIGDSHNNTSAVSSQGSDINDVYHSKDCRFSQKISPTMDANPLQAC